MPESVLSSAISSAISSGLARAESDAELSLDDLEALLLARGDDLERLLVVASRLRDEGLAAAGRPGVITFSKKVFLPITTLCRDRCHYCIFVDTPGKLLAKGKSPYMSREEIVAVAREGAAMGCKEALFTLGDRPEDRWEVAREWLTENGYESTLDYIRDMAKAVLEETGLLPHLNPGVMSWAEMQRLKPFAPSMGMMLETTSVSLWSEKGQAHYGSPDKDPAIRLQVLEDAGRSRIPFSTGVLLGIGETHRDRAESMLAIRESHERWGHIQETIVQNFRAKPGTAMQNDEDLALQDYIASVAVARIVMGPHARIQVPPNLTDAAELHLLVRAGIDDWGGVSPLTPDHVNPERPWPQITTLAGMTAAAGYELRERLTAHPEYTLNDEAWIDGRLMPHVSALLDPATGLAEEGTRPTARALALDGPPSIRTTTGSLLSRAEAAPSSLGDTDYAELLDLRGDDLDALAALADGIRHETVGDDLTFVANRNLDLTMLGAHLSEQFSLDDVDALVAEAVGWGATEVCAQGALAETLAPGFATELVRRITAHGVHLHAFRPAELLDGARHSELSLPDYLEALRGSGLGSVPGTGARVLDDRVRGILSNGLDIPAADWISVITAAHRAGLRSTSTLVYGHIETPVEIVAHLRTLTRIQDETGGFTEFIPMPNVQAETALPGVGRKGPTADETRAMIAVSRLMLTGRIDHIQVAWPKLGLRAATQLLRGGADDFGGLLTAGKLYPAAGAEAGRELSRVDLQRIADELGRGLRQRTTSYGTVPHGIVEARQVPVERDRPKLTLTAL
ncbi:bifunctional FO biosynthesis protein CofGH [soil metagenome]